jgi:hypothetical protein
MESAGPRFGGDPPNHRYCAIETVIGDLRSAPALVVQSVTGDYPPCRISQKQEYLHGQRLDVQFTRWPLDQPKGRTHPKGPQLKVLAHGQVGELEHGHPRSSRDQQIISES